MPRLREPPGEKTQAAPPAEPPAPEIEVIKADEPVVEVIAAPPEAPQEDDATVALKRQIESLQKSEQVWKDRQQQALRERDEALQRAREREVQLTQTHREAEDREEIAISATFMAAQAGLAKARQDKKNAIDLGDSDAQAQADIDIAQAVADLREAQRGKDAIEERKKQQPQPQDQQLRPQQLPQSAQTYISRHPEIMNDRKMNRKARYGHEEAVDSGITAYSPEYFAFMDEYLGFKEEPVADTPAPKPKTTPIVSAPVSREVPSVNGARPSGKVVLTREEQEAAAVAGITLEEYAKQKLLYQKMRADGTYGDQR
jgi:hypothetical protein